MNAGVTELDRETKLDNIEDALLQYGMLCAAYGKEDDHRKAAALLKRSRDKLEHAMGLVRELGEQS